jgi:hypothetical protein
VAAGLVDVDARPEFPAFPPQAESKVSAITQVVTPHHS